MKRWDLHVKPGDRVQRFYLGKAGDTGLVLRIFPRPRRRQPGSVKGMVEVKWDSSGHTGRVEDRQVRLMHKICACGIEYSKAQWEALKLLGHQVTDDEVAVYDLELRNCSCGSTMGIEWVKPKCPCGETKLFPTSCTDCPIRSATSASTS